MNPFDCFQNSHEFQPSQEILLRSLGAKEPRNGLSFFKSWVSTVDFESLDYPSFLLMPLLFHTFREIKDDNPYYGRMKGIYRYLMLKNTLLITKLKTLIIEFKNANIDFILFKGIALVICYYKNYAVRPMGDIDFLIHQRDLERAEKILSANGIFYRYEKARREALNEHSFDYIDADGNGYDLHWYSLYESKIPGIDNKIWQNARTISWEGFDIKVMSPEDLIFTICINGIREIHAASKRYNWIFDVIKIMQEEKSIRWKTLVQEGKKRNLTTPLFDAFFLINYIAPDFLSEKTLYHLIRADASSYDNYLRIFVEDNKGYLFKEHLRNKIIEKSNAKKNKRFFFKKKPKKIRKISDNIKYFLNNEKQIYLIYLNYKYLPLIKEFFDISDETIFLDLLKKYPASGEGYIETPPDLLTKKKTAAFHDYSAEIIIPTLKTPLQLKKSEIISIPLNIKNTGSTLWLSDQDSSISISLSYHLLNENNICIFENKRTPIISPRKDLIIFLSNDIFETNLQLESPDLPGKYIVKLDIVHECISWFSAHKNKFPEFEILVT